MDYNKHQSTIGNSREESLAKAVQMLQGDRLATTSIKRPDIATGKVVLGFIFWCSVIGIYLCLCLYLERCFRIPVFFVYPVAIFGCFLMIAMKAKPFVINAVLLYQKHAPERIRRSCLFVPSCSEYMLLAVGKYGVLIGVYKGLHRLLRCHHPNGGEDYP